MKDIGSRTDIIYNALNTTDFPGQNNLSTTFYKKNGVKFVVSPYPMSSIFYNDIMNYIQRYQFDIPFRTVIPDKYFGFCSQLRTRPYTGTCAIMDLLCFNIKALYITGIDFYNTPYYTQYRRIRRSYLNNLRENNVHLAYPQMEYLLFKSLTDNRVVLDNTLEKLLYNQYIKFASNLMNINTNTIMSTNNSKFLNIMKKNNPKVLIIGKDYKRAVQNIGKYDIVFCFFNGGGNINS
jgi:hypothetical protein